MKYLLINSVCGIRSTGRICTDIAAALIQEGHEVKIAYGRETVPEKYQKYAVKIGTDADAKCHAIQTRLFDTHGFGSRQATARFLKWAEDYDPDVLWLHNLHGYYIQFEMLFDWIRTRPQMRVKWTLHDCWAFTGHCTYFSAINCQQWKSQCRHCVQTKQYPSSYLFHNCRRNFQRKKKAFCGVQNMTLITPSQWLADLVKESFLKDYPVEVHNNTVDTTVFQPTQGDFRERYGLQDKKIILGVASDWSRRKGIHDFFRLPQLLGDEYKIVMVGLSEKQMREMPKEILGIRRTNSASELAQIYTAADLFFNPTYEDNYPTVNLEARACATPILTYRTGGSPESAGKDAIVVEQGDLNAVVESITQLLNNQHR